MAWPSTRAFTPVLAAPDRLSEERRGASSSGLFQRVEDSYGCGWRPAARIYDLARGACVSTIGGQDCPVDAAYVAASPDQPVHVFEGTLPFSTFIVVPPTIGVIPIGELLSSLTVTPFVEDVYVNLTSPRSVFKNVVLFLNVTIATPL